MLRLEAPQNATLLSAGSISRVVSSSFGDTGSTNAVGIGNGTDGASALNGDIFHLSSLRASRLGYNLIRDRRLNDGLYSSDERALLKSPNPPYRKQRNSQQSHRQKPEVIHNVFLHQITLRNAVCSDVRHRYQLRNGTAVPTMQGRSEVRVENGTESKN
jgi:hypothetical protein